MEKIFNGDRMEKWKCYLLRRQKKKKKKMIFPHLFPEQ